MNLTLQHLNVSVVKLKVKSTLAKVDDLLDQAGTDKTKLLSANIWLKSMNDFGTNLSLPQ